jgi:hypothetical protein
MTAAVAYAIDAEWVLSVWLMLVAGGFLAVADRGHPR